VSIDERPGDDLRPYGRRTFLAVVASGLTSLWWGKPVWDTLSPALRSAADVLPAQVRDVIPSGWRIYTVAPTMPVFTRRTWRLKLDGLVAQPLELSYDELLALPRAEQVSDFHCVTGWSVKNVHWAGVRFADLLRAARPLPEAKALTFVSAERPYVDSLTLEEAYTEDAMLAYQMDGKPLARPHGAPARVVIPEMYGYKNVKWVERIIVAERPLDGYWEVRGYDRDAWVGRSNGHYGSA
jgi:DMSO/TMAO reductase YedYZ molybdopterin-dependent catalytic subunit